MSRPGGTTSYAALLRVPGAAPAFAAAALLRLSYAAIVLSLLLVVQEATGSFSVAGAVVAVNALPTLLSPYKSRLIDRVGVRRPLVCLGVGYALVLSAMVACAVAGVGASLPYLLLGAAAGVLSPPVGPVMRGIWAALTPDETTRSRAYSLDAVSEEGLFAVGPLLVGAVVAVGGPAGALAVTAACALAGACALGTSRAAAAACVPAAPPTGQRLLGPLLLPGVRWIVVAMLAVGFALAPLELAVVARATEAGTPAAAGYLLAALSVGSAAGGLLWGRLRHRPPAPGQLLVLMLVLGVGTAAAGLVSPLPLLAVVIALTGCAVAPAFVVAYVLADRLVDAAVRTETGTWVASAANLGGAAGAAVAGLVVEHVSARAAFALGGGLLVVVLPALLATRAGTRGARQAAPAVG